VNVASGAGAGLGIANPYAAASVGPEQLPHGLLSLLHRTPRHAGYSCRELVRKVQNVVIRSWADANERDRRARMPRAKCVHMREMWRFRKEAARPGALNVSAPRSHGWRELAGQAIPFANCSLIGGRRLSQGRA